MTSELYPVLQDRSLTITDAGDIVNTIFAALQDGKADTLKVIEELAFMSKVNELLRKKPGLNEMVRDAIRKANPTDFGDDGLIEPVTTDREGGAKFSLKTTGVRYDYASCGDPLWDYLAEKIQDYTERKRDRETFLKGLPAPVKMDVILPPGNTFQATITPPVSSGTDSFEVRLSK